MIAATPFIEDAASRIRAAGYSLPDNAAERAIKAGRDWEKMRVYGAMPDGVMTSFEAMERALLEMAE